MVTGEEENVLIVFVGDATTDERLPDFDEMSRVDSCSKVLAPSRTQEFRKVD